LAVATPSRPKAGGGRLFVVIGTVLALVAFGLFAVLGGALVGSHTAGSQKVVVAAKDIPLRSVISPDQLEIEEVAPAPPGAYLTVGQVKGQAAQLNITKGQPITSNMISKNPDQIAGPAPAYLPIPKGFVAITIPTSEQQGVGGYPQPGDYLTVTVTLHWATNVTGKLAQSGGADTVTKTVFTNLRIIRVGPSAVASAGTQANSQGAQTQGVASSLTVLMTQCDAEYMNWFLSSGTVKYQLESYKDYASPATRPDPSCPAVTGTKGVGIQDVENRYHFSQA
jgi:Flp pilus assembly protein CpaB